MNPKWASVTSTWEAQPISVGINPVANGLTQEGVQPRTTRFDDGRRCKGYLDEDFVDAFSRYTPVRSVTPCQRTSNRRFGDSPSVTGTVMLRIGNMKKPIAIGFVTLSPIATLNLGAGRRFSNCKDYAERLRYRRLDGRTDGMRGRHNSPTRRPLDAA
jgi:hypothetical protein